MVRWSPSVAIVTKTVPLKNRNPALVRQKAASPPRPHQPVNIFDEPFFENHMRAFSVHGTNRIQVLQAHRKFRSSPLGFVWSQELRAVEVNHVIRVVRNPYL